MIKDIFGKTRQKIGLHIHTTQSDGKKTPGETAEIYKESGYDAIAITDHWKYSSFGNIDGLKIINGAEYNIGANSTEKGVYHIVALFCEDEPDIERTDDAQTIINKIHKANGLAVLAHPAWSLNTPDMIMALEGIDATEIYNTVSEKVESFRADSSLIVDMIIPMGRNYPLLATDDTHFYDGVDNCKAYIMAESDTNDAEGLKKAIVEKRFYATQGPEIHLRREGDKMIVNCSPSEHIYFASNASWAKRSTHKSGAVYAEYDIRSDDVFVRAFCIDKEGRYAWTNAIII